ncbi:uncharacterized protein [Chiloscyllium punctatum]|uniref:uncharacterized protein n=1 Tax=Chiloscyllium punctatum TaxID=137246 RepID=UPI003B6351FD
MWTLILLICSIPVSDALWAEKHVTGILGRAITISCHYEARWYQSNTKYWCQGWTRQCKVIATTNWPNGRTSITDNKTQGIFLVTIKNLQWGDAGWYSCGIEAPGLDPMFIIKLHISDEAVSVPGLRYLSQPNVSCSGGSVTVSCESAQGSLPIHYTWSEKTPSQDSKISDTNKLDLHCQSFTLQHHQYYCTASNTQGTKPSEIVHVSVHIVTEKNCSYKIKTNGIGTFYMMCNQRVESLNDDQELASVEENLVYANINHIQKSTAERQKERRSNLNNDEITYAALEFQKKSSSLRGGLAMHTDDNSDSVIYSDLNFPNQPPKGNKKAPVRSTPQESGRHIYADIAF